MWLTFVVDECLGLLCDISVAMSVKLHLCVQYKCIMKSTATQKKKILGLDSI